MRNRFDAFGTLGDGSMSPGGDEHEDQYVRKRYRTIFISDLHLGTPGCQAVALLDFLKAHPSDKVYLVGDIADGWPRQEARSRALDLSWTRATTIFKAYLVKARLLASQKTVILNSGPYKIV